MSQAPIQLDQVSITCRANVYYDGRVVSYGMVMPDGNKRTLGVMHPGTYRFDVTAAQTIVVTDGQCQARLGNQHGWGDWGPCGPGTEFAVAPNSAVEIHVTDGLLQYMCVFEQAPSIQSPAM